MKLDFEKIKEITLGAVYLEEKNGTVFFHRLTAEQEALYDSIPNFLKCKARASSGIKLCFKTDSRTLKLDITVSDATTRSYFALDVYCEGVCVGGIENNAGDESIFGDYSEEILIGEGMKTVSIYLPWSTVTGIRELSLEDGSEIIPVRPEKKMILFGDSITQGYDAEHPALSYASRLTDALNVEGFNKGLGGEMFFPPYAELKDPISPDYVTVAFGTNDWMHCGREETLPKIKAFYTALSKHYPNAKIFAISPLWRGESVNESAYGKFELMAEDIENAVAELENVIFIYGGDLVPKEPRLFADSSLHPNDRGFDHHFVNLYKKLKKYM